MHAYIQLQQMSKSRSDTSLYAKFEIEHKPSRTKTNSQATIARGEIGLEVTARQQTVAELQPNVCFCEDIATEEINDTK